MAFGSHSGVHQLIGLIVAGMGIYCGLHYSGWFVVIPFWIVGVFGILWFLTVGHALFYGPFLWLVAIFDVVRNVIGIRSQRPSDQRKDD